MKCRVKRFRGHESLSPIPGIDPRFLDLPGHSLVYDLWIVDILMISDTCKSRVRGCTFYCVL